ncbi:MAG TPA: hypothetical protein DCZ10_15700 [Pelotomaculum sp.]|nr:hypothetical protein [Pelotomaculum sp.]
MINVAEILYDPDLNQDFTVYRKTGTWTAGRYSETETPLSFTGVILPANAKEINQFPEGDRVTGMMKFFSEREIYVTRSNDEGKGTSDQILWSGHRYRIINVKPYKDYGYYRAFGVYMDGE